MPDVKIFHFLRGHIICKESRGYPSRATDYR